MMAMMSLRRLLRDRRAMPIATVVTGPAMARHRRRHGAVVTMVAGRSRGGRRRGMMVVDPRLGGRGGDRQQAPGCDQRERRPDERFHDSILCPARAIVTTHARNCFNTMGTSPGKSSLIRPGPNASAQAA